MSDMVLSDLPETAQWLVREMQRINFGRLEGLRVRGGLPVSDPKPRVFREVRLGANAPTRSPDAATNFHLTPKVTELMENLCSLGDAVLTILIKDGLPFHLVIEE